MFCLAISLAIASSRAMVALLFFALLATVASGSYIRYPRASASAGSGSYSGASSSSFSSSSGTRVAPGPGGYGQFNAFAGNFPTPPSYYGSSGNQQFERSGASDTSSSNNFQGGFQPFPFGFPGFTPFVPQYGVPYPYQPFPTYSAPFDFTSFLNQYFQSLQNFQAQAAAQAQQAAASGHGVYHQSPNGVVWSYSYPRTALLLIEDEPLSGGQPFDTNEVGGNSFATYGPTGGYGSASVFPKPEGGLETRFGGNEEAPQNTLGPVGGVSGSFQPPSGSSYGVFTSSASGSSDINGKKTSFKQSTIGVNDNGKVTTYTAHEP